MMTTTKVPDQRMLSFTITRFEGEGSAARRHRIHCACMLLRKLARNMGGRLTEGRRRRNRDGSRFVEFVFVKRRRR